MTDKEFKRLKRSQLIEIIYELQLEQEKINREKEELQKKIDGWQCKIAEAGSIAEATVALSDIFDVAQRTADKYLAEIHFMNTSSEQKYNETISEAQQKAAQIIEEAEKKSSEKLQHTEEEIQKKWDYFQQNVTKLLNAHSELEVFLNQIQK